MFSSGIEDYADPDMGIAGLDPARVSTAEQARPLPVTWGTTRVGITFISNAFNPQHRAEVKEVGKGEHMIVGYHYNIQFAALVCHGPVSYLHAIYFDNKKVWPIAASGESGPLSAGSAVSSQLLFNGQTCLWEIYWGTENQVIDTRPETIPAQTPYTKYLDELATLLKPNGDPDYESREYHTAYKGQCYIVARNHYMGYNRTNVQNIELVVSRCPTFSGITPAKIGTSDHWDSNIPVIIADALTNKRYGLGLPSSYIDTTSFAAVATTLSTEGVALSPVLTSCQPFDQFLVDLLNYVDGYFFTTRDGKIGLGLNRGVPCEADEADENLRVLRIDETCLIARPRLRTPSIASSRNSVYVSFTNAEADYQSDAAPGRSAGTLAMQGDQNSPEILDRPWVSSVHVASKMASVAAKVMSLPADELTVKIRKSKFTRPDGLPIMVGNGAYFSWAQYRLCHSHYVIQDIRQGDPHEPFYELVLKRDRGYVNVEETDPVEDYVAPGAGAAPSPTQIAEWAVIEAPARFDAAIGRNFADDDKAPKVIVCASKPDPAIGNAILSYQSAVSPETWTAIFFTGRGFKFAPCGHFYDDLDNDDTTAEFVIDAVGDETLPAETNEMPAGEFEYVLINNAFEELGLTYTSNEIIGVRMTAYNSGTMRYSMALVRGAWDTCPDGYRVPITSSHKWFVVNVSKANWLSFGKSYSQADQMKFILQSALGPYLSDATTAALDANQRAAFYFNRHVRPVTPKYITCADTWNVSGNLAISWEDPVEFDYRANTYRVIDIRAASDTELSLSSPPSAPSSSPARLYYKLPADDTSKTVLAADLAPFEGETIEISMWTDVGGLVSRYFARKDVSYA